MSVKPKVMFIKASDMLLARKVPIGIKIIIAASIGRSKIAFTFLISFSIIPIAIKEEKSATKGDAREMSVTNSNSGIAIRASANPKMDLTNEEKNIITNIYTISVMLPRIFQI